MSQGIAPISPPGPGSGSPDKNQLLLLGLQLLNKSLRLPCAVVPPQVQTKSSEKPKPSLVKAVGSPPAKVVPQTSPGDSRKRKRDHSDDLSEVEKREKRKMMNRVAAQNARDRRKQYIDDLEQKIALLESQNQELQTENRSLRQQTNTLTQEKRNLEKRLSESESAHPNLLLQALVKESLLELPAGSAVPHVSPQQKQVPQALLLQALMTSDLLAQLLVFPEEHSQRGSCDPTGAVTRESCDTPPTTVTIPAMVGGQPGQVEPPPDSHVTERLCSDQLVTEADATVTDFALDSFFELDSNEPLPDIELEKLLHPFTSSIMGPEEESWDIESLFAV